MENRIIFLITIISSIVIAFLLFMYSVALDNVYAYKLSTPNGELSEADVTKLNNYNRLQYVNSYIEIEDEGYLILNTGKSKLVETGEEAAFGFEKVSMIERLKLWFSSDETIKGELHEHFKNQLSQQ